MKHFAPVAFSLCAFASACSLSTSSPTSGASSTDGVAPAMGDAGGTADAAAESASDSSSDSGIDAADDVATDAPLPPSASLTSLSIDELTMSPTFSPDNHDYAVRCAAGTNTLTVRATGGDATTLVLSSPSAATMDSGSTTIDVAEDQALVVEAHGAGGDVQTYSIRCLPHDFPSMVVTRPGSPSPGYYLLGNTLVGAGKAGFAMILDGYATPIWYRRLSAQPAAYVTTLGTNQILYTPILSPTFGTDPEGKLQIVNLETGATSTLAATPGPTDHHEVVPLPSGNFLVQSYPRKTGVDLSGRDVTTTDIADCHIQEIAPDGTPVWDWYASDHFDVATEATFLESDVVDGQPIIDGFHCNSIDVFPGGDLLVSARHLDAVFRVEHATGKVLWKLGGVASNKDGAQILSLVGDTSNGFHRQHDARVLPSGELSFFDNHGPAVGPSRALHVAIDTGAATGTITWEYVGAAGSGAMGSVRLQSDGATVISWGMIGVNPAPAITEVDATGTKLFEVAFDKGDRPYRAVKVPTSAFDLDVLRRTAGK